MPAVTTEAQLCNIALGYVGQRRLLGDLEEATTEAQMCKAFYGPTRDAVLASYRWSFATRRAELATVADVERNGWLYVYALPADCVEPRMLYNGLRLPGSDERAPFTIELRDAVDGFLLLTDVESAELIYTARITTVGLFPALFVDAVAWRLAGQLALGLSVTPQVGLAIRDRYPQALSLAMAADSRQGQDDVVPDSEFIRIRG